MAQLMVHGREVETVFELMKEDENAMTYSLGWALANCKGFCQSFTKLLDITDGFSDAIQILLQEHSSEKGYTDIELIDPGKYHIIIEAKRGFNIPSKSQLEKYADRLHDDGDTKAQKMLVVLAESDRENKWLPQHVPTPIKQIAVKAISWREVQKVAHKSVTSVKNHEEKRSLRQLVQYLGKVTTLQNQNSNMVWVVPLNDESNWSETDITFFDVVNKFRKYFHPIGGYTIIDNNGKRKKISYPKEPPNYIAFRYHGALLSIHHVESYKVIENYYPHFPVPKNSPVWEVPHYLYELGPAIKPAHRISTNIGKKGFRNDARHECFIDLLLTCKSVAEAWRETEKRKKLAWAMEETD